MKSLAWIEAENAELVAAANKKHAASICRLKRRLWRVLPWYQPESRRVVNDVIDSWVKAEAKRGKR